MNLPQENRDATEPSDAELMLGYANGEIRDFEQLYHRHKKALYQYVLKKCSDKSIADELYQDVWARVISSRHGYTPSAPFRSWLYRIARNRVIDYYRSNKSQSLTVEFVDTSETQITTIQQPLTPDELAQITQSTDALQKAINTLPQAQQDAVLLHHVAGMSLSEIADTCASTRETIKSRLRYAVIKLREYLRETV